jgi:hypothetical protein
VAFFQDKVFNSAYDNITNKYYILHCYLIKDKDFAGIRKE